MHSTFMEDNFANMEENIANMEEHFIFMEERTLLGHSVGQWVSQ